MFSKQRSFSGLSVITQNVQTLFIHRVNTLDMLFIPCVNTLQSSLIRIKIAVDNLLILYIVLNLRLTNCHGR